MVTSFGYVELLLAGSPSKWEICILISGILTAIASGIPFPLLGIIFGQLVDDLNGTSCSDDVDVSTYQDNVNSKILIIVYLAIAQFILMYAHLACWSIYGARLAQRLRYKYLYTLLQKPVSFFDTRGTGQISSRINSDIQTIRSGTSEKVGIVISSISFFITAYVVAFVKNTKLAAILLSLIPAYFLMSLIGNKYIEKFAALVSDHAAKGASIALESLSNIPFVHAFNANRRLEGKFAHSLNNSRRDGIKKSLAIGIQAGLMYFVAYAANALAFWQGSVAIAKAAEDGAGSTSVGKIYTVIFILVDATLVLSQVAPFIQIFSTAVGAASSLQDDMGSATEEEASAKILASEMVGSVKFDNVSFTYPTRPDVEVLKGLSVTFPGGKHTALVGQSGSGKSTIAELVEKLYTPSRGAIYIDDYGVKDMELAQLRSFIGYVEQNPTLFSRSILENIAMGLLGSENPNHSHLKQFLSTSQLEDFATSCRNDIDPNGAARLESSNPLIQEIMQLVHEVAVLAKAYDFIQNLKYGYATPIGTKARTLSGGQKQRIAIARALIRNPRILILDEATSAIDSQTESQILNAITGSRKSHQKGSTPCTLITIAHRLSTIKEADKIFVLKDGALIEEGTHVDLVSLNGVYSEMVKLQQTRFRDDSSEEKSKVVEIFDEKHENIINDIREIDKPTEEGSEDSEIPSDRSFGSLFTGIWRLINKYSLLVLLAFIGSIVVGGSFSAEAVIFGNTVSQLNTCRSPSEIRSSGRFFGLMFFFLGLVEFFANVISWTGFGIVSEQLLYKVREASFQTLLSQKLDWHHSGKRSPASLLSIITKDGTALSGLSGSVIGSILSIFINLIAAIILTNIIAWKIALVCLSTVPLLLGAGMIQLKVLADFEDKHENAYASSVEIAIEALEAIKTVSTFSLQSNTIARYKEALRGPRREIVKVSLQSSLWQASTYFIGNLSYALAFWWGSKQIVQGIYSTAQFLIVVMALLVSAQLWNQMFAMAPDLVSGKAAVSRILNLMDLKRPEEYLPRLEDQNSSTEKDLEAFIDEKLTVTWPDEAMSVSFKDVNYAYASRKDHLVLKGLNINIPSGKFGALVGASGAGKSTIISLIERLYIPTKGQVLVGGLDINRLSDNSFRDNIALVPQDCTLFEGTIKFNVLMGARPDQIVSDEEIEEACRFSNIHESITKLPGKYQTECGSNGVQLSGGQRQRIAIARALIRKPKLLLLDESTSALDAESEKAIQESLSSIAGKTTILTIAHRYYTIQKADIIFMIDDGKCVDQGSHAELYRRNELYRATSEQQRLDN